MTPVAYLDSVGLLRENTLLAHCVHLTDEDRKIIARRGAVISHCPVSNMKLCSGTFDLQAANTGAVVSKIIYPAGFHISKRKWFPVVIVKIVEILLLFNRNRL